MVPGHREWRRDWRKYILTIMQNFAHSSMHHIFSLFDYSTIADNNSLMSKAHPKQGKLTLLNDLQTNTKILLLSWKKRTLISYGLPGPGDMTTFSQKGKTCSTSSFQLYWLFRTIHGGTPFALTRRWTRLWVWESKLSISRVRSISMQSTRLYFYWIPGGI